MRAQRWWTAVMVAVLLTAAGARGAELPPAADASGQDALALAARIDHYVAAAWRDAKVQPVAVAGDAEFMRRVYLDLAGRIPAVSEVRAFLKDPAADKRQRLIERLLASPRYTTHFTTVWRSLLMPEANTTIQTRAILAPQFEDWLRKQVAGNVAYDQMVRDIITAPVSPEGMRAANVRVAQPSSGPLAFYLAKEVKPENLAGSVSRLFLGVRLECAQCHNHPFAEWRRDQFWSLAAFFSGLQRQGQGDFVAAASENTAKKEIAIPGTERVVQALFLDGTTPQFSDKANPRATLAQWMTAADNPYFARAAVNRMWSYFFGAGLIDPVDEMVGADNTASHPQLLDELAKSFAAHKFDLKFLIRAITASQAYQLTSATPASARPQGEEAGAERLVTRMPIRALSPEQLFDSVAQAIGYEEPVPVNSRFLLLNNSSPRGMFLNRFANHSEKPTEQQLSILQALALMNGKLVSDATSLERSETLAAVVDAPFMDMPERIETLFLATFSRLPTEKELARTTQHVHEEQDKNAALADVFWVLLNSAEFILNH